MRLLKGLAAGLVLGALMGAGPAEDLKSLKPKVLAALRAGNLAALQEATSAVVRLNSKQAAAFLLELSSGLFGKDSPEVAQAYWMLLDKVSKLSDPEALECVGEGILNHQRSGFARDLAASLSNQKRQALEPAMLRLLEEGPEDLKIIAADHLSSIGGKSAVEHLIKALGKAPESGTLRRRIGSALAGITGEGYGDSHTNWKGWWEANKEKWEPLRKEERADTGVVTDSLSGSRATRWMELKEKRVLVVGAGDKCCGVSHDLDNLEQMAARLKFEVDLVDKKSFESDRRDLGAYIAILANCTMIRSHCDRIACPKCAADLTKYKDDRVFNCSCPLNKHPQATYVMGRQAKEKLKKYVEGGGYLFAEDWCMEDFLAEIFPQYVKHGPERPDETVSVLPKAGNSGHPYLRNVFSRKPQGEIRGTVTEADLLTVDHRWKIDRETRCIKVVDPKRVVTLMTSPDLDRKAERHDAVAVTFAVGDDGAGAVATGVFQQEQARMTGGRVLYVLSHFGKQESRDDEYTLQNLLLNFLMEASERRMHTAKARKGR